MQTAGGTRARSLDVSIVRERSARKPQGPAGSVPRWDYQGSGEKPDRRLERVLIGRAQAGDNAARERILRAHVALVVAIARQYQQTGIELEDLVQEGMVGLCIAVDRFDLSEGCRFTTYASYWIRERVLRARDCDERMIRLPVRLLYAARRAGPVRDALAQRLGRQPTLAEVAAECGVSPRQLQATLGVSQTPLSLEGLTEEDSSGAALKAPEPAAPDPEAAVIRSETARELRQLLDTLPPRDRLVLEERFGLRGSVLPAQDLAARLGVSQSGIRQIQHRALGKLREKWGKEYAGPSGKAG